MREEEIFSKITKFIHEINKTVTNEDADSIAGHILNYSKQYEISPVLITALIGHESKFQKNAVSRSGALGLGQLMPQTIKELGIQDPYDAKENIHGTIRYLKSRMDFWENRDDKIEMALASYCLGLETVRKYQGIPPEAHQYISKINELTSMILNL